jgi:hypothetical protein
MTTATAAAAAAAAGSGGGSSNTTIKSTTVARMKRSGRTMMCFVCVFHCLGLGPPGSKNP